MTAAIGLGRRFVAKLEVLHVQPDPASLTPFAIEGMSAAMIQQIIEAAEKSVEERMRKARSAYDQVFGTGEPSADWRVETGPEADICAAAG